MDPSLKVSQLATVTVSQEDVRHLAQIRANVVDFMRRVAATYAGASGRLLDIAPQVHEGSRPFFPAAVVVETFDIVRDSGCTFVGDICSRNECLKTGSFDFIVCTEVLEHTLSPLRSSAGDEAGSQRRWVAVPKRTVQFSDSWASAGLLAIYRAWPAHDFEWL